MIASTAPVCIPGLQEDHKNGGLCATQTLACEVIIEATNANLDPEPVHVKRRRGYLPRAVREVIFGVCRLSESDV